MQVETKTRENPADGTGNGKLGFIGLGYMGSRIARRLAEAELPLIVYNRSRRNTEVFESRGAEIAATAGDLAASSNVILSCLADDNAVLDVYLGAGHVLSAQPGTVIIEMSTVAPETPRQLAQAARRRGIELLDVAISGSTPAAEAGALTLFGGGDPGIFEAVAPIFSHIAKQWFYMGPIGSGVSMKLVVNTLLGVNMQAIAEAVALGRKLGLDRESLLDTLSKTAVVAPAHVGKLASAKADNYAPQFPARLMNKDFRLITAKAVELGVPMPATFAASVANAALSSRSPEEDFSAVIRSAEGV